MVGQVVFIIVYHIVGIGNVGGKPSLGYFFTVYVKLVKPQSADGYFGALTAGKGKPSAKKGCGNVFFKSVFFF